MKIAFATDTYWPRVNGVAVSVDTFASELVALGHEVHVLTPDYPDAGDCDARRDFAVHRFPSFCSLFSKEDRLILPGQGAAVRRVLDEIGPDVVHSQTEMLLGRASWRWAKARGVPLVMTSHTLWEQYIHHYLPFSPRLGSAIVRALMRRVYAQADAVVAPSRAMREVLRGYGIAKPIEVLPTGFQQSAFEGVDRALARRASPLFERFPQLAGRPVLLTVGRVAHEKNLGLMLEVVERLRERIADVAWLVVGDGPTLEPLRAEVASRGLREHVVTTGYLDRAAVKHAFALADVFCMASRTETQGLVTVEALATGCPVVAVDAMGTRDVLTEREGGFLVPAEAGAFSARVESLLADTLLARRTSQAAKMAARRFSSRALAERLCEVYRELTGLRVQEPELVPAAAMAR